MWWVLTGSNRRHAGCKPAALPTELRTQLNGAGYQNRTDDWGLENSSFAIKLIPLKTGGGDKDRTCYILLAKQALSQMSYTPQYTNSIYLIY